METQATIRWAVAEALVTMIRVAVGVAQAHRCPLYLVGGFVRDFLLGRESFDLDFAVGAEPLSFASEVAERLGARFVPLHIDPPAVASFVGMMNVQMQLRISPSLGVT